MTTFWFLFLIGIRPILSLTEADLKRSLLSSAVYDPSVRPRINASHAVHVQLDVHVVYIVGLKEKESAFDQACFIYVSWRDEYLTWNTSDYGGLDSFVVQPSVVWTPDVTVYGRLDKRLGLEFGQVRVNSDGVVNTKFLGLLTTQCAMNSAHFPFDYQLCAFLLGSEIYSPKEVAMEIKSVVQLESSKNNPNWNLDNVRKIAEPPYYWQVQYCLQRKSLYLAVLYMVPTFMHAVLILISYIVPSEAGEKISFGVSLFLSFMVVLLQLNGDLPEMSTAVPALEIFFMLHMTSGVVSLVVSAISAYITHNNSQQTVSVNKVKDVSTATTNEKRRFPNVRQRFRDTSFLNRAGFVVSLSLILAANLVMFNAKLKSSGCT
ncbi:acetylcholine receptor subunit beta-like [Magallana gigas]|uniref:acetylcholine receptor subunit beta-like n=1 Tax=Magallana gigas TaxID=29159 RepID=UPI00333F4F4F